MTPSRQRILMRASSSSWTHYMSKEPTPSLSLVSFFPIWFHLLTNRAIGGPMSSPHAISLSHLWLISPVSLDPTLTTPCTSSSPFHHRGLRHRGPSSHVSPWDAAACATVPSLNSPVSESTEQDDQPLLMVGAPL
jgi:hypothetical protein